MTDLDRVAKRCGYPQMITVDYGREFMSMFFKCLGLRVSSLET